MDYQFPRQLYPVFYNSGPPNSVLKQCCGKWGSYDRVIPQGGSGPLSSWTFTSSHRVRGETWRHTEPVSIPLLSPKNSIHWPSKPPDPMDFIKHMQNFFVDHSQEAFGCMVDALVEDFNVEDEVRKKYHRASAKIQKTKNIPDKLAFKKCQPLYSCEVLDAYSIHMSDVVHAIPPELLGALLHEELTEQRDRMLFFEGVTGGALAFIPSGHSSSQHGCLLYPGNQGLDCLNFHKVELKHQKGGFSCVDTSSCDPFSVQLKAPIRQISTASLFNECCVAVRSDHLCGVWRFSETVEPRLLQVVNTKEVATCISTSPHVLGEVLVVSESGAAKLWTVGRGIQTVREEDHNLYFNAKSSWRWCEFSAHPRVMLYADRTGVELTDLRVNPVLGHTLFRVSNTAECRSGERVILSRYLGDIHTFHHLITTQYSAYILDERFPTMPMLKWDHMMQAPPMFCHVVPGSDCSGSVTGSLTTTKLLLGSHSSQEVTLLQYSGGRAEACYSLGPPQSLHRPRDSLKHLPVQIPHRHETAKNRLSFPAAGLTCIQQKGGGVEECICVLQLTETGDIFYQILESEQPDASGPKAAEDEALPEPTQEEAMSAGRKPTTHLFYPASQLFASDTSSDEDIIGPTQALTTQRFVAETPEKKQQKSNFFDSSSEESDLGANGRILKTLGLKPIVNDLERSGVETVSEMEAGVKDGKVCKNNADNTEEHSVVEENVNKTHAPVVKLSDNTLIRWKHWLQKLMRKSGTKEPCQQTLKYSTVSTKGLLQFSVDEVRDPAEEERVKNLRRDLSESMAKCSLLLNCTISGSLTPPDEVPLPNPVDTDAWTDPLSQRLTVSWQGEEAWQAWWKEELGLNREEKVAALRKKRRREKEAKRASGRRLELSGSFSSSISYQSRLDNNSDSTGWSSQGAWSESESIPSQFDHFGERSTPVAATPSLMKIDASAPSQAAAPQSMKGKQRDQHTPNSTPITSLPQTPNPAPTPTSQRRARRRVEDYLSSLFAPQDEASQHDSYFLEEESTVQSPVPPETSSSQLPSSQSISKSVPREDLSQDTQVFSRFSQSLSQSQSQSSQGRLRLSQASQPKKKKSRIGF